MIEFIVFIIMLIFIIIGLIMLIYSFRQKDYNTLKKNESSKFSIIIPARDESKVIEGLLKSIINQSCTVNPQDVYIVVESKNDKTCNIAKKYNMNIVLRRDLSLKRKGYAIDDAISFIKEKNKRYDLYFIFDADNILDKDFISNMLESYKNGYDIAIGYRNTKNGNDSVVAAASSLTFTMINTMFNKFKVKQGLNVTISGTGFYISGSVIDKLGGYPFNTLTEDYELSVYSSLAGLSSTYNEKAIFYDEQPVKYKITKTQRTRWIRGYIDTRKKYNHELKKKIKSENCPKKGSIKIEYVGIKPYLLMVIGLVFFIVSNIVLFFINLISNNMYIYNLLSIAVLIIIIYIVLAAITFIMIKREKEYFGLTKKMKIMAVIYNPIFLLSYIPCAVKALLNPNIGWSKIEHNKNI